MDFVSYFFEEMKESNLFDHDSVIANVCPLKLWNVNKLNANHLIPLQVCYVDLSQFLIHH